MTDLALSHYGTPSSCHWQCEWCIVQRSVSPSVWPQKVILQLVVYKRIIIVQSLRNHKKFNSSLPVRCGSYGPENATSIVFPTAYLTLLFTTNYFIVTYRKQSCNEWTNSSFYCVFHKVFPRGVFTWQSGSTSWWTHSLKWLLKHQEIVKMLVLYCAELCPQHAG